MILSSYIVDTIKLCPPLAHAFRRTLSIYNGGAITFEPQMLVELYLDESAVHLQHSFLNLYGSHFAWHGVKESGAAFWRDYFCPAFSNGRAKLLQVSRSPLSHGTLQQAPDVFYRT